MQKVNFLIDEKVITEWIPMEFFDYHLFGPSDEMKLKYGAKTQGALSPKIESVLTYIKNDTVKALFKTQENNKEVTFFVD